MIHPLIKYACSLFCLISAISAVGAADLEFTPTESTISPTIEQTSEVVVFAFKNTSSVPVHIKEFKGGCGCITHILDKDDVAPGESGLLTVFFEFKEKTGIQKRKIGVITTIPGRTDGDRIDLLIQGEIPTPLLFSNKSAIWANGAKPIPKDIFIKIKPGFSLQDIRVENSDVNPFLHLASTLNDQRDELHVVITPVSTDTNVVSPAQKKDVQQAYFIKYKLMPQGIDKRERFYALIYNPQIEKKSASPDSETDTAK